MTRCLLCAGCISNCSFIEASVIAARKSICVSGGFGEPRSRKEEREAERRKAHHNRAAACFPDCRKAEAHGNAFQRPAAAFFKTSVRSSGDLAHGDFAPLPVPVQPHQWQGPVVSPDGNPRPPDDAGHDPHARRRRSRPALQASRQRPFNRDGIGKNLV